MDQLVNVGLGVAFALVVVAAVLLVVDVLTAEPTTCPWCGGDLVEWVDEYQPRLAGRPYTYRWTGCPKVRDRGAGSPAGEDWTRHYARAQRA